MRIRGWGTTAGAVFWLLSGPAGAQEEKSVQAARVAEPPRLDGDLSDPAWSVALPISDFRQQEPAEGAPPSERTEVRVLFTEDALYLGVWCHDAQPEGIRATERRRDGSMQSDDALWIVLDTAHDHRNAYFLRTNPLGAQWDALVSDEGKVQNRDWDGLWDSAARIEPWGWGVEIRIPFATLRIPDRGELIWGVDFRRFIRRKNEIATWSNYRRDHSFLEVSRAGHLVGLSGVAGGLEMRVKPYAIGGMVEDELAGAIARRTDLDAGLEELRFSPSSRLQVSFSANPDFAQAEVDDLQVNLTRFPLFFEEKREFFLEDAGLFELGTGGDNPDVKLLHTRRIGLTEDREPIPILLGSRLGAQFSGWSVGLMNVQTRSHAGSTNFGIYRVKRSVLARSYVGLMSTLVRDDAGNDNTTLGADAHFVLFENLTLQSFLVRSATEGDRGGAWAALPVRVAWETDLLEVDAQQLVIERDFLPAAGFVRRADIRESSIEVGFGPRPRARAIRQIGLGAELSYLTDLEGNLLTRDQGVSFELELESGDSFELELTRNREFLDEEFELAEDIVIEPGTYSSQQVGLEFRPFDGRTWSGFFRVGWEEFWGGRRSSFELDPTVRWSDHFLSDFGYELEKISLPQGELLSHLVNARLHLSFSNQWLTSTTVQYSSLEDEWGFNFRLNYIYRTDDDLFFIVNRIRSPERSAWSILVKFTHTLRL